MSKKISAVAVAGGNKFIFTENEYVTFNDQGIIAGPDTIVSRWDFLPQSFQGDLNAADVSVDPSGSWRYVFVKGDKFIIFDDDKIIQEPERIADKWTFLNDFLKG